MGKFIPGVTSLSSWRQCRRFIFIHENKEQVYLHLSNAAQSKDVKSPIYCGGGGFCMFWEPFAFAEFRCPEVMLCLRVFFFSWVAIRK